MCLVLVVNPKTKLFKYIDISKYSKSQMVKTIMFYDKIGFQYKFIRN